jgi:uncharacterized membrane protein
MDRKSKTKAHTFFTLLIFIPSFLFGCLTIASLLAPIFEEHYCCSFSNFIYKSLSNICRQFPSRSLWIMDRPMGLCGRCFAIYFSFSIGLLIVPVPKAGNRILLVSFFFLPLAIDGFLQLYDLRDSTNFSRLLTGLFFGVAASTFYKYFVFHFIENVKRLITGQSNLNTNEYVALLIGLVLTLITNLYDMAIFYKANFFSFS